MALERLVGFLGEVGIKLAELGRLGDKALIGALDVIALHLERLLQRFRADELLGRGSALLEHLLRIVRDLDRDRLNALRERPERPHRRIHVVLAELLHFVDLDHGTTSPGLLPPAYGPCLGRRDFCRLSKYMALHKNVKPYFAVQYEAACPR